MQNAVYANKVISLTIDIYRQYFYHSKIAPLIMSRFRPSYRKIALVFCFVLTLGVEPGKAQISPPGLGSARTASWLAVGFRKQLDTTWQSMSYIGWGHKSNPDNNNPVFKPAILILNQEFYNSFSKNWQYSLALSYRQQDEYAEESPYLHNAPRIQHEVRAYGRLSYILKTSHIKFVSTIRQELRKFYASASGAADHLQLRSRFRMQLTVHLNAAKTHNLIAGSEQLFATTKETKPGSWTKFGYKESRFTFYYSHSPKNWPCIVNLGYMNNLLGKKSPFSVHYIALDVTLVKPPRLHRHKKAAGSLTSTNHFRHT